MSATYEEIMASIELGEEYRDEGPDRDAETVEQGHVGTFAKAYSRLSKTRSDRDCLPEELCELCHEQAPEELMADPKSMSAIS